MNTRPYKYRKHVEKKLEHGNQFMKHAITSILNNVMKKEARAQTGARRYKRTPERKASLNGYKKRGLNTMYGKLELMKPQLREKPFKTNVFDRYSRAEKAIKATISESVIQGVSTRKMRKVLQAMDVEMSKTTVSEICQELDPVVKEFMERPLELPVPYLFVDATYVKVRDHGRVVTKALFIAMGVNEHGYKEVLGIKPMKQEDEESWTMFFQGLKERGLNGVQLVVSDGHRGIKKAVEKEFLGAAWQYCHVHFRRNIMKSVPLKQRREVNDLLNEYMENPAQLATLTDRLLEKGHTRAVEMIERHLDSLFNYQSFPTHHWIKLRTTNSLENINSIIKRRTRPVGAYPNDEALLRVVISLLIDLNEEFLTDKRHIDMERTE